MQDRAKDRPCEKFLGMFETFLRNLRMVEIFLRKYQELYDIMGDLVLIVCVIRWENLLEVFAFDRKCCG